MIYVAMTIESLSLLLMSRIPVGIFMQTMTMARSIVSDCSTASSRARALATNVGVPAGLGFIMGPMVGGILSSKMPLLPPLLATCLFFVAFLVSYVGIPETAPVIRMTEQQNIERKESNKKSRNIMSMITRLLYHHVFASKLFLARSVVMLAYLIMQSSFHVFAYRRMNLETRSIGLVLTYCGIVSVSVDFFVIPYFHRHFGNRMSSQEEQLLVIMSALCLSVALIAMAMSTAMPSFLISIVPLASSSTLFKRNVMSLLTKCVPAEEVGTITGMANAFDSVCRIIEPALAAALMEYSSVSSALLFGSFLSFMGACSFHLISKRADAAITSNTRQVDEKEKKKEK